MKNEFSVILSSNLKKGEKKEDVYVGWKKIYSKNYKWSAHAVQFKYPGSKLTNYHGKNINSIAKKRLQSKEELCTGQITFKINGLH